MTKSKSLQQLIKKIISVTFLKMGLNIGADQRRHKESKANIIYPQLEKMPIKVFYQILKTQNLNLIGKGSIEKLTNKWAELLEEYWLLFDKDKYQQTINKSVSLLKKQNKITTVNALIILIELGQDREQQLYKWGYKSKDEAIRGLRILSTNLDIQVAKSQLLVKQKGDQQYNIYKDLVMLEQILNRSIDINNIMVPQWIEYIKMAKFITSKNKTNERNKKN